MAKYLETSTAVDIVKKIELRRVTRHARHSELRIDGSRSTLRNFKTSELISHRMP